MLHVYFIQLSAYLTIRYNPLSDIPTSFLSEGQRSRVLNRRHVIVDRTSLNRQIHGLCKRRARRLVNVKTTGKYYFLIRPTSFFKCPSTACCLNETAQYNTASYVCVSLTNYRQCNGSISGISMPQHLSITASVQNTTTYLYNGTRIDVSVKQ